jgi:hypothetical protein
VLKGCEASEGWRGEALEGMEGEALKEVEGGCIGGGVGERLFKIMRGFLWGGGARRWREWRSKALEGMEGQGVGGWRGQALEV